MEYFLFLFAGLIVGGGIGIAIGRRAGGRRAPASPAQMDGAGAAIEASIRDLRTEFRAASAEALHTNQEQFLALAEQRFLRAQQEGEATLERRELAIRALLEPMTRALDQVRTQTVESERMRTAGEAALGEQVRQLLEASRSVGAKADTLVNTLRRADARGSWGEVQLRRVVELAGMLPHVDFTEQGTVRDSEGRLLRPDMTVHLAGGRTIVVDAKVALMGLLEAEEADDAAVKAERLAAHARHVRRHVDDLASKRYWDLFESTPEFVVMFVPSEAFHQAALESDPSLQEYAYKKGVFIATPTTLVAMLRTVAHAWREDALARDAQQVLVLGKELHDRLATMAGHLGKVGKSLDQASRAYNSAIASLESRVLVSARRFGELQHLTNGIAEPERVTTDVRELTAPEFAAPELTAPELTPGERPPAP